MNVGHARACLIRTQHHAVELWHPIRRTGHGVLRYLAQIARLHQILQRLRRRLFVQSKIINRLAYHHQVLMQRRLSRVLHTSLISLRGHPDQDKDDRNDDHQFDERKTYLMQAAASLTQR